jgi:hypothetical protein
MPQTTSALSSFRKTKTYLGFRRILAMIGKRTPRTPLIERIVLGSFPAPFSYKGVARQQPHRGGDSRELVLDRG